MSAILREGQRLLEALRSEDGAEPEEVAAYASAARASVTALAPEDGPALAQLLQDLVQAAVAQQTRTKTELDRLGPKRRAMGAFGQLAGHAENAQRMYRRV